MDATPKNIVVCSDGTGNAGGKARGTNVWRLFEAVDQSPYPPRGQRRQIAFHDDGVGTEKLKYVRALTGAFGYGISRNLRQLYAFLIQNYEEYENGQHDDIYLFGFSRGAFTVRVLANMVNLCGLPCKYEDNRRERTPTEVAALARQALRAYKRRRWPGYGQPQPFKDEYSRDESGKSRDVRVKCVGVWDTVDAVGLPIDELTAAFSRLFPLRFSDNALSSRVDAGLQALSIDDERYTFHPVLWEAAKSRKQVIKQVWFAGVHSNVGGGYPKDQLSYIPLNWMMEQVQALEPDRRKCLRFQPDLAEEYRRDALFNGQLYDSRAGVAAYYRYAPRRLDQVGEPTALTKGLEKGPTKRQMSKFRPDVHASVAMRIYEEIDGYAPTAIPQDYSLVGDSNFPIDKLGTEQKESPSGKSKRVAHLEFAYDFIWWRRVLYYTLVAWTLWIIVAGWAYSLEPIPIDLGSVAWVLGAFAAILPWPLADIVVGYQKYPTRFLFSIGVYLVLWFWNRHLRAHIRDIAVDAWHLGFGQEVVSGPRALLTRFFRHPFSAGDLITRIVFDWPVHWIARLARTIGESWRSVGALRRISYAFEWGLVPLFAGVLLVLIVAARPVWNYLNRAELTPYFTPAAETIDAGSRSVKFETRNPLQATGWKLVEGERYGIEVADVSSWRDLNYPATPAGLGEDWQHNPVMWSGMLLRRDIGAPWFQLRGVIITDKDEEVDIAIGNGAEFKATATGELFLFVNDVPGLYENNHGTATIVISRWPYGKVPQEANTAAGR